MIECPICDADMPILLGVLGDLAHLRCRDCGMDFNIDSEGMDNTIFQNATLSVINAKLFIIFTSIYWDDAEEAIKLDIIAHLGTVISIY